MTKKVKPFGPWVLIEVDKVGNKVGSLYVPDGNLMHRLGHLTGTVIDAGKGEFTTVKVATKSGRKFVEHDLKPKDRVMFRGYLSELNHPGWFLNDRQCLIHIKDVLGKIE